MSGFDPKYAADALAWLVVWSSVGVAGRVWLARHAARRPPRGDR
jgi:hypothetical protein